MELLVLGLVATIGFASYALWSRARTAEEGGIAPPALEAPDRTPANLQVGDVVQHVGTDYLVEGVLTLSEGGPKPARLYRLADGGAERFLYATPAEPDPSLLDAVPALAVDGAPEAVLHGGRSFRLRSRTHASVLRAGAVGESRAGAGDRVGLLEYATASSRLVVIHWSDRAEAFAGERVPSHLLELLPGR